MRGMKSLAAAAFGVVISICAAQAALDVSAYRRLAEETMREAISGKVDDVETTLRRVDAIIAIAVDGARSHAREVPADAKVLEFVVANIAKMKSLGLDDLEAQWHDGAAFKEIGVDWKKVDQFGKLASLADAIIHPVTAHVLLREYAKSRDAKLLDRVKEELNEVLEHVKKLG